MSEREQLMSDLKLLVQLIPEEIQDDISYFAANRLYDFIDHHTS